MKIKSLIIAILCSFSCFAQQSFKKGDVVNVWAIEKLQLFIEPGMSDKSFYAPYGARVTIMDVDVKGPVASNNPGTKKPSPSGWVQVSYNGRLWYVISEYLSFMPCFNSLHPVEGDEAYLGRNFGQPTKTVKKVKGGTVTTRTYKNGIVYILGVNDGCNDVKLDLVNITRKEGLLFSKAWLLDADAAQDVKVQTLKNGKVRISYNSCD